MEHKHKEEHKEDLPIGKKYKLQIFYWERTINLEEYFFDTHQQALEFGHERRKKYKNKHHHVKIFCHDELVYHWNNHHDIDDSHYF